MIFINLTDVTWKHEIWINSDIIGHMEDRVRTDGTTYTKIYHKYHDKQYEVKETVTEILGKINSK